MNDLTIEKIYRRPREFHNKILQSILQYQEQEEKLHDHKVRNTAYYLNKDSLQFLMIWETCLLCI